MPSNVTVTTGPLVLTGSTNQRPNTTTPYAANAVVGGSNRAVFPFAEIADPAYGTGYVLKVRVSKGSPTPASVRLWLFNDTPGGGPKDGDPFRLRWDDHRKCIGYFDLDLLAAATSDAALAVLNAQRIGFLCLNDANALYGVLTTRAAYTPAKNEPVHVELLIEQGVVDVHVFDEPVATTLPVESMATSAE